MDNQQTVYIVDDDRAVGDALELLLQAMGYRVELYCRPEVFLENIGADRAGCLLLDVHMPGMDGLEVQRRLNARGATLPIIFITGHGDEHLAARVRREGAAGFIEKPFSTHMLLEQIRSAFAGSTS